MNEQIEQEVQAKGLTAPRVTMEDIEENIAFEHYFTALEGVAGPYGYAGDDAEALSLVTFCVLVLRNGTKVVGVNYGPVSTELFNESDAKRYARENAIEQIWPLMGYWLKSMIQLADEAQAEAAAQHFENMISR